MAPEPRFGGIFQESPDRMIKPGNRASLSDLEGSPPARAGVTSVLERTIRHHRNTPVERLGTEALRLLLEAGESVAVLLPLAIGRLERDPFMGGDFHPGDLLVVVLRLPASHWVSAHELRARAFALAHDAGRACDVLEPVDRAIVRGAVADFTHRWSGRGARC
jgi:hypothetical protein